LACERTIPGLSGDAPSGQRGMPLQKKRREEGGSVLPPREGRTLPYLFFADFFAAFLAFFAGFFATFLLVFFALFFTATVAPLVSLG
jgi:hypothetical protein